MRDLIGNLEVVDDDTASALRVIDHFDRLVDERASTAAIAHAHDPGGRPRGGRRSPDPLQLPTALEQARTALRLAADVGGLAPAVVRYDDLGALAVIAERISAAEPVGQVTYDVWRSCSPVIRGSWTRSTRSWTSRA